ncbi:MAG: DNA-directed RNA polymerase subunit omega [bacterium]
MAGIPLVDLMKKTDSLYEAVVIMCRRARQINDEQKLQIEMEMEAIPLVENRDSEDFGDVEIDREALLRDHKTYPKPSIVAMEEMQAGKIEFKYDSPSEEEGEASSESS